MKMIHILLADDDKHIRELLHYHLQKEGFTVFEAEDGKVAQEVLEKEKYSSCDRGHYDAVR